MYFYSTSYNTQNVAIDGAQNLYAKDQIIPNISEGGETTAYGGKTRINDDSR